MSTTASVALRVDDNMSATLTRIRSAMTPFRRDVKELEEELGRFSRTKVSLQVDLDKAKRELADAKKAFRELEDEANGARLEKAQETYNTLAAQLQEVNKAAKQTTRDIEEMSGAFSRTDNRVGSASMAGGGGIGGAGTGVSAILGSQLANQLGQSLSQAGSAWISSAFGDDAGTMANALLSGVASGASSGAALGTLLGGPGLGTAIGGAIGTAVGALSGAISGQAQIFEKKDDYFKAYYNGIIDQQAQEQAAALQTGSGIAAGRETDQISFSTLFGSENAAKTYLSGLVDMANTTPFLYGDLTAMSKTLATYGYGAEDILPTLTKIGDAGAALGMATSDMTMVATALGRMKSSDKATLEYLNILNDRGIGAVGMLAEAKGMSVGDTYSAISKGEIKGSEAVEIILSALEDAYGGNMKVQSQTFAGLSSTLEGLQQELQNARGEGYNTVRGMGVKDEITSYGGELGEAMKELEQAKGAMDAYNENLQDRYTREALEGLLLGKSSDLFTGQQGIDLKNLGDQYKAALSDYKSGDEDVAKEGARQMALLEDQARALAQAAYDSSDWVTDGVRAEIDNTDAIRTLTGRLSEGILLKYQLEQEKQKGFGDVTTPPVPGDGISYDAGGVVVGDGVADKDENGNYILSHPDTEIITISADGGHASGLQRVPHDNYLALLHEGERVLTAREVREADAGGTGGGIVVNVTGNQFNVRTDADIDTIAQAIADEIDLRGQAGTF